MRNDEVICIPQDDGEREKLGVQAEKEAEKTLFNYGCAMTARGLNKGEMSVLMHDRNGQMDAPLCDEKIDELTETAFMFALKDDVNINLPTIVGTKRQLLPLLDEMYGSLESDISLFRHGGGLVSIRAGVINRYTPDTVITLLSRRANYVDSRQDGMFPPVRAASAILFSCDDGGRIRTLNGVVNNPTLRADGTIFDVPGYDATSKLFYHPTGNISKIDVNPTQEGARRAANWLLDIIGEFPFETESDRVNFLGLLLTFVVREMCSCVPMALIDAPAAGTGKSLLSKIAGIVAVGRVPDFGTLPTDEAEMRKTLTSKLQESPSILVFDNTDDVIKSGTLSAVITAEVWQDRQLGRNRILHLPMRVVLVATGNNIKLGGDMPRRCYRIRIDANTTKPWMRGGFRYRLPEYAAENRGEIITALLTMARSWIVARRPKGDNQILGGFESWCRVVGGILQYAGLNGFLGNLKQMYRDTAADEDDTEQWAAWMGAIHAHWGDNAFTVKQLAEAMNGAYAVRLREDAPYSLGEIGTANERAWLTRLGAALRNRRGQVFKLEGDSSVKLCQGVFDRRSGKKQYWLAEIK